MRTATYDKAGSNLRTDLDLQDFYVAKARRLRSQYIHGLLRSAFSNLRGLLHVGKRETDRPAHGAA